MPDSKSTKKRLKEGTVSGWQRSTRKKGFWCPDTQAARADLSSHPKTTHNRILGFRVLLPPHPVQGATDSTALCRSPPVAVSQFDTQTAEHVADLKTARVVSRGWSSRGRSSRGRSSRGRSRAFDQFSVPRLFLSVCLSSPCSSLSTSAWTQT